MLPGKDGARLSSVQKAQPGSLGFGPPVTLRPQGEPSPRPHLSRVAGGHEKGTPVPAPHTSCLGPCSVAG